jgi:carboxypeptidase Q
MKLKTLLPAVALLFSIAASGQDPDSATLRKLYSTALETGQGYEWLRHLSNEIGGRLSGSPQAAQAIQYTKGVLDKLGADTVYLQEVMVPHWVRNDREELHMIQNGKKTPLRICALGGSVATPKKGLRAQVVEIKSFEELEKLGEAGLKGKIVFYNTPLDQKHINTFNAYGEKGTFRYNGAKNASKYGAVGSITRSLTLALDNEPHTGAMAYDEKYPKIPCCAISTLGADQLSAALKQNPATEVELVLNCETLPDVMSYNIIAEIRGSEKPGEIVLAGAHLDAWDNGDGAHDDGAGCVQSMEIISLFRELGIRPKRTVRVVLFMNEENGLRGGLKYAEVARQNKELHIAAIESDAGGFTPHGFFSEGTVAQRRKLRSFDALFKPYGIHSWNEWGGGAALGPLQKEGTLLIGLLPDSQRYFDLHHTAIDTFDKINRRELLLGTATMAALVYLLAEHGTE